jgi:hypothetical protein
MPRVSSRNMLVPDASMSDNGSMTDDKQEKGLEALEVALASADPADAPEIAEELAAVMGDELDEATDSTDPTEERPS